jgi:uncharacterized protein (DUF779 family)
VVSAESNRPAPGLKPGATARSPFYVGAEFYERWGSPRFVLDVGEGEAGGFSREESERVHFHFPIARACDHRVVITALRPT